MSMQAQAERERQARVISWGFGAVRWQRSLRSAKTYTNDPVAHAP